MMTQSTRPSRFRWRRVKALFRLLKWIFWTERKKRYLGKGERWEPLKGVMYETLLGGTFCIALFSIMDHLEYFFPFWVPEFPAKAELLEASGSLNFHCFSARKKNCYFTITQDCYGIDEIRLRCQSGFGGFFVILAGFSVIDCFSHKIPSGLDWKKTVARYHPQWGLIELVVDGHTVPNYTYEHHKSSLEKTGKSAAYRVFVSFLIILFYLVRDCQLYRQRRARLSCARLPALSAKARKKHFCPDGLDGKTNRKISCD
jgi:hypothetical protein